MNESLNDPRTDWFQQARFGMFVHWGLFSILAGEWKGEDQPFYAEWIMQQAKISCDEYEPLAKQFNPQEYDAKKWVDAAKAAGMKYLVVTAKHHDGFCMYDTKLTDYNVVQGSPYGKDPMKELAAECAKAGITFCFYYSDPDWRHPEFPAKYSQREFHGRPNPDADLDKYVEYVKGQLTELLTNYGPIGILWFDTGGAFRGYPIADLLHSQEIIDLIHSIQPNCLVNNRLGLPADYGTPEQRIPGKESKHMFEVCMTMNGHWGFHRKDENWKSAEMLIHNLVDIAGKGGNYLLNIGPDENGVIPPASESILREIGQWMDTYGDTIYGSEGVPFHRLEWGRCTTKPGRMFLHVFDWPSGALVVPGLRNKTGKAYLYTDEKQTALNVTRDKDDVLIELPLTAPNAISSVVVLEIEGVPEVDVLPIYAETDGKIFLDSFDAEAHGEKAMHQTTGEVHNIGHWVDVEDWGEWEFVADKPGKYQVEIRYSCPTEEAGSVYSVLLRDHKQFQSEVKGTGSWDDYSTEEIGEIEIPEEGRYMLSVVPEKKAHYAVMNLASITLIPLS
jgi:alpha-L-fucosidase